MSIWVKLNIIFCSLCLVNYLNFIFACIFNLDRPKTLVNVADKLAKSEVFLFSLSSVFSATKLEGVMVKSRQT